MDNLSQSVSGPPALSELRPIRELQLELAHIFPSRGSLDWEIRAHRNEYVAAGAIFEVAGRLMAHPPTFARTALEIGARKIRDRSGRR